MIVGKLQKHVNGEHEMSATQIAAARILLNKTVPDLKAYEPPAPADTKNPHDINTLELVKVINGDEVTEVLTAKAGK